MKRYLAPLLLAWLMAACSDTGPVFPTPEHLEPWLQADDALLPGSDRAPAIADPIVAFRLAPGETRSALRAGGDWGLGQTWLFGFDIRLDPARLPHRPVVVSRFVRQADPAVAIATVSIDSRNGISVMGRSCVPPDRIGTWHRIEARIRLSDGDDGFLELFCDRRPAWARAGLRTTQPPTCRRAEGCTRPVPRPVRFEWQFGLLSPRPLARALGIEMQRIIHHRLFVIPNRVGTF